MRTAVILTGVLACAAALGGCSPEPAAPSPTAPAVDMTTPGATEPPPTAETEIVASESASPSESASASESAPPPTAESTTSLSPVEQPPQEGGPWTKLDLTLRSGADIIKATELPESLRAFLTSRVGVEDETGCVTEEVILHGIHSDGFAYGTEESNCAGGEVVWGITDNQWHYIVQFGDPVPCADLAYNGIPAGAPGLRCLGDDGSARDF
ncbi:hypothetical protein H5392_09375 [Tessaracoccus sp. MC1865]|uniref:hypothetical protein n=1 Tax=Tessaracoccus sp. MC1865 TaxID=2760310 RepID=UPI001601C717|nr:hypothetical protein [Tessaracoccus sp. MC1865]MBB1484069.1 hypothetical protein [Tessaracoccus sp. MC1865]QTO37103.1 hypothetical protein J7D54_11745 [Tessaracoccus sp. MC1865]